MKHKAEEADKVVHIDNYDMDLTQSVHAKK